MNNREDVLRQALQKNEEESQRWQAYIKDNETAIENMSMFSKRLAVDVMVPVGKKAFMYGNLLHTNEVLVGHYQGYFSKCTTFKAKEICEFRIKNARDHLKQLETEAELLQNKLDKPYAEGVVPSGEEREIIEDYDKEQENVWRKNHQIRVKDAKKKEQEERNNSKDKENKEIFKMLEEAELMEELEQELDTLEVEEVNEETIRKLMSGEIKLPQERNIVAHVEKSKEQNSNETPRLVPNVVKYNDLKTIDKFSTNNNVQPNLEMINSINSQEDSENESDEEQLPQEVTLIKEQAGFLNAEDQIGFYDYQAQIIRQKIEIFHLRTPGELDEKIRLLSILEHLEGLLEEAEEVVGAAELELDNDEINEENESQEKSEKEPITKTNQKRRISFALEDQTLEFRKHEAVTQMSLPKTEKPNCDIIKLDNYEDKAIPNKKFELVNEPKDKKRLIQDKVEENMQFVSENQSKQDFDLIGQILQSSTGEINTLHIKFQHSPQEGFTRDDKEFCEIPGSPADIYDLYIKSQKSLTNENEPSTLFINSYNGEDQVSVPILKEDDRPAAFIDPKSEFSNPSLKPISILKNKEAVNKENHFKDNLQNNTKEKITKRKESKMAFNKVMGEVYEKPLTEPEPLPDIKFIDAHTPKQRISLFQQKRLSRKKS